MLNPIFNGSSPYPAMGALPHDIQFVLGLIFFITPVMTVLAFFIMTNDSHKYNLAFGSAVQCIVITSLIAVGAFDDASAPPIWIVPILDVIISLLIFRWALKKGGI